MERGKNSEKIGTAKSIRNIGSEHHETSGNERKNKRVS